MQGVGVNTDRRTPLWDRKQAEGKSNREALRCLKRHLARRVHRLLSMPPIHPDPRARIQLNTAISVPCLT